MTGPMLKPEQIAALVAEGKRLQEAWDNCGAQDDEDGHRFRFQLWASDNAAALLSTIESLQADGQDAKRYRWSVKVGYFNSRDKAITDAEIDAAIGEQG